MAGGLAALPRELPPTTKAEDTINVTDPTTPTPRRAHDVAVLRRASAVLALTTAVLVVAGGLAVGRDAAVGAVIGGVVVLLFFGSDNVMSLWLRDAPPTFLMAVAFVSYGTKIAILGVLLMLFHDTTAFSVEFFGATVAAGTVAWLLVATVLFGQARIPYVDPGQGRS